jgi:hypothetical protein
MNKGMKKNYSLQNSLRYHKVFLLFSRVEISINPSYGGYYEGG